MRKTVRLAEVPVGGMFYGALSNLPYRRLDTSRPPWTSSPSRSVLASYSSGLCPVLRDDEDVIQWWVESTVVEVDMVSAHTPGPWSHAPNDLVNGDEAVVRSEVYPDGIVAVVWPWGDDEVGSHEREANARLIAAAPDLLEALENITGLLADGNDAVADLAVAYARAAIAKARGAQEDDA